MKFTTASDNRAGSVSARAGKADAREENYNVEPSKRYATMSRPLAARAGAGAAQISLTLETSSEYVGFRKENYECTGLTFKSKGTITLPQDAKASGTGVVQESISMGVRINEAGKVRLTASVLSDMDIAEVRLQGPSFDKRVYDDFDDTLDITTPGEYILKGAYQLLVRLPNP